MEAFVRAQLARHPADLEERRRAVVDALGAERVGDIASMVAFFDGMNRVAEGTGTQLDEEA